MLELFTRITGTRRPAPSYDDLRRALLDRLHDAVDPATGLVDVETGPAPPPGVWVVVLSPEDHARRRRHLAAWSEALAGVALAEDRRHDHALGGVATVRIEPDPGLRPGTFRVRRDTGTTEGGRPGASPGGPAEALPGRPRLVLPFGGHVLPGHEDGVREVLLTPGRTVVGRGPEAHVQLGDVSVSLVHAVVDVDEAGDARLRDAGSVNGVRVDGVEVQEAALVDGNRVELGEASLVFRRDPVADDGGRQGGEGGGQGEDLLG